MATEKHVNLTELQNSIDTYAKTKGNIPLTDAIAMFRVLLREYTYICLGTHSSNYTLLVDHRGLVKDVDTQDGPVNLNAIFWNLKDYHKKHGLGFSELMKVEYKFTN